MAKRKPTPALPTLAKFEVVNGWMLPLGGKHSTNG
jgi:hypothetical protein